MEVLSMKEVHNLLFEEAGEGRRKLTRALAKIGNIVGTPTGSWMGCEHERQNLLCRLERVSEIVQGVIA